MKYFVEFREGVFHVEIEDAADVYLLLEQLGVIEEGTAEECYREGREVSTEKSTARRIWGEEMDDRKLMIETMKGNIHKKTTMSVRLPKPKKVKEAE